MVAVVLVNHLIQHIVGIMIHYFIVMVQIVGLLLISLVVVAIV